MQDSLVSTKRKEEKGEEKMETGKKREGNKKILHDICNFLYLYMFIE